MEHVLFSTLIVKTLFLLRHAKSSWKNPLQDIYRPLQEKGIDRILRVAQKNGTTWNEIDAVFSSPAQRALHTASIACIESKLGCEKLTVVSSLYSFSDRPLLEFVHQLDNHLQTVMLVGHNPAMTQLANYLSNRPCPDLKTAAWAKIQFDTSTWNKVHNGVLTWEITS